MAHRGALATACGGRLERRRVADACRERTRGPGLRALAPARCVRATLRPCAPDWGRYKAARTASSFLRPTIRRRCRFRDPELRYAGSRLRASIVPENLHAALTRPRESREDLQQSCLTGAIPPQQCQAGALFDIEADIAQGRVIAVVFPDVLDLEGRRH